MAGKLTKTKRCAAPGCSRWIGAVRLARWPHALTCSTECGKAHRLMMMRGVNRRARARRAIAEASDPAG